MSHRETPEEIAAQLIRDIQRERDEHAVQMRAAAKRVEELEADIDVIGGKWCAGNQAEGRGPCGICRDCWRERASKLEAENARLRALVDAARDVRRSMDLTQEFSAQYPMGRITGEALFKLFQALAGDER